MRALNVDDPPLVPRPKFAVAAERPVRPRIAGWLQGLISAQT